MVSARADKASAAKKCEVSDDKFSEMSRDFSRKSVSQTGWGRIRFVMVMYLWGHRTHTHHTFTLFGPVSFHMSEPRPGPPSPLAQPPLAPPPLAPGPPSPLAQPPLVPPPLAPHSSRRSALENAAAGSSACKTRSQPAARPSCLSVSARPCVQYAARVHAKPAMVASRSGLRQTARSRGKSGHGEEKVREARMAARQGSGT